MPRIVSTAEGVILGGSGRMGFPEPSMPPGRFSLRPLSELTPLAGLADTRFYYVHGGRYLLLRYDLL